MIIIDSDVAIDVLRKYPPAVAWISSVQDRICLPGITALELYQGCHNKAEVRDLQKQIAPFAALWPNESECINALANFVSAHLSHSLGLLDSLIAATALSYGCPLYTFNQKHFVAVPNLQTIQPYVR